MDRIVIKVTSALLAEDAPFIRTSATQNKTDDMRQVIIMRWCHGRQEAFESTDERSANNHDHDAHTHTESPTRGGNWSSPDGAARRSSSRANVDVAAHRSGLATADVGELG